MGPTAVGKSPVAIELALALDGEIVVADSRQVYRRLEIATNKPSAVDRERVRYHCLDLVEPEHAFNVHLYVAAATEAIAGIQARGRLPIIEGGSGLYVDAIVDGLSLGGVPPRPERRSELALLSVERLAEIVRELDPAADLDFRNRVRLERAIEILEVAGPPLSNHRRRRAPAWSGVRVGLDRDRALLDARIGERCVAQLDRGLVEETRRALEQGVPPDSQALKGTGYADTVAHLQGRLDAADLPAAMVRSNRQLARRQLTWFRRGDRVRWFDAGIDPLPAILKYLRESLV